MFSKIFQFFSPYTDVTEKRVAKFFEKTSSRTAKNRAQEQLIALMQEDLVRLNIYLEYRFKGYKKLTKSYRKKLYENAECIKKDFLTFYTKNIDAFKNMAQTISLPEEIVRDERLIYLLAIMQYLRPGEHFQYEEGAAFERLLRNPLEEKLIGDCNQIVTLYIYLYSQKFPVTDLQVKLLPKHVCLHFRGNDIEATAGIWKSYSDYTSLSSTPEIIATNILDVVDSSEKLYEMTPKMIMKAAEIAYLFSSNREIVKKNLNSSYHNIALQYLRMKNFSQAEFYFKQTEDAQKKIHNLCLSAVSYYLEEKKFSQAKKYAQKSGESDIMKKVIRAQAIEYLQKKQYARAASIFRSIGDAEGEKAAYQNELASLSQKIRHCKTITDYKRYKSTLREMRKLAYKIGNQKTVVFCDDVLKRL